MRIAHDNKRAGSQSALHLDDLKIGDIVCVYSPSAQLKKLTYQWSGPDHIVLSVKPNTCTVRCIRREHDQDLKKGGAVSRVPSKMKQLPSKVINRKMMSSYPVPSAFFLGARVLKEFGGKWYQGIVDDVSQDDRTTLWHVSYSDFA